MTELRQRQPRLLNPAYLAWLRLQSCACGCLSLPPSDAAHIRAPSLIHGKEFTGRQKPSDHWAVPLRHDHHMAQHAFGSEVEWWAAHGKDPFRTAISYNRSYLNETGKSAIGKPARSRLGKGAKPYSKARVSKPRPASKRSRTAAAGHPRPKAKIAFRRNPWPKGRKIHSRSF